MENGNLKEKDEEDDNTFFWNQQIYYRRPSPSKWLGGARRKQGKEDYIIVF